MENIKQILRPLLYRLRGLPLMDRGGVKGWHLQKIIKKRDPRIMEFEANHGEHTQWLHSLFPECEIHCFEPEPRAIKRSRERIAVSEGVQLHEAALGSVEGEATFYRSSTGSAKDLLPDGWDESASEVGEITIFASVSQ